MYYYRYVGFGIGESQSGGMLGADIVTASVDDATGEVTIADRYVPWVAYPKQDGAYPYPLEDDQQDWEVVSGSLVDGVTAVELVRALDTGVCSLILHSKKMDDISSHYAAYAWLCAVRACVCACVHGYVIYRTSTSIGWYPKAQLA